ncbi:Uncharacterized conserved protein YbaA, DUF1428 family [Devosia sp. YR412]|uniref:DUF1428 domain-containing protein n=1 Tax=Devosia sp. YR412 TaxID=1881030 RepID=UPI0008B8DF11|nr:DUF1428 domain-containing protein [Devosia sp. YR412]SEP81355.1 Uncharacterized conserved protein YbaA, DUF1428 family [Devosia sp. YR412]
MSYFDCYLIPVPVYKMAEYKEFSAEMAAVYVEYGAIAVVDCVLDEQQADGTQFHADGAKDEVGAHDLRDFMMAAAVRPGETVVISWTEWPNKEFRDRQLPQVLADPRVQPTEDQGVIFEGARLVSGGFIGLAKTDGKVAST